MHYFLAVAETLHFRKAAERLHMSQPPLSQQISALEEDLGVKLFIRDRRSVRLTEAGQCLLNDVRLILGSIETARRQAVDTGLGRIGRLRIGFIGPAIDGPLGHDLKKFSRTQPGIALDLHEKSTPELVNLVREQGLDMGVVRRMEVPPVELECLPYHREEYVLAVPATHSLAGKPLIEPHMLDNEPLIMFPRQLNPMLFDAWAALLAGAGAHMHVAQEVITKHATVALVAAGLGISPVPRSTAETGRRDVAFIPFTGNTPLLEFQTIVRQGPHSPPVKAFLEHLAESRDYPTGA
ncbi:LysR family transcriptional regulator [Pseudodesulfovibrio sp. S3]|nr:LysR family transcriptional regulator [Pseudodesulfovibrio sp. S3]